MFEESSHKYWDASDSSKEFISVTTLVHKFVPEFDSDFFSSYKALEILYPEFKSIKSNLLKYKRITKELIESLVDYNEFILKKNDLLKLWEDKTKEACEHGTNIHLKKELSFYINSNNLKRFKVNTDDKNFKCRKDYYEFDTDYGVYPEYLIGWQSKDKILNLSGQVDLIIKDGNDLHIVDWKTNAKGIEEKSYFDKKINSYKTMLYPLNNLMDCNLLHYTMQLSTYAFMLQGLNPKFNIASLSLVHIDRNNNEKEITLDYRKEDVIRMLNFYKNKLKIKNLKNA